MENSLGFSVVPSAALARGQRWLSSLAQVPARGMERETPKINSGLSFFFPSQGRSYRLRLRGIHSLPVDSPSSCSGNTNQAQPQSNSSIPSSGGSLGAGIPLISSTIPLGAKDIKGAAFNFHLLRGLLINTVGKYPPSNYDKHLEGTVSF